MKNIGSSISLHTSFLQRLVPVFAIFLPTALPAQSWTFRHFAGSPGPGNYDGAGGNASFFGARGVATDATGNVYVADSGNSAIRRISPTGVVTTFAGLAGVPGSADGTGAAARFSGPDGIAVDASGTVYVADTTNEIIRKITPAGVVTTLAGMPGAWGSVDGTGGVARFNYPTGIAVDASGNVYVADDANDTIRKITPAGLVTTLAGLAGTAGSLDGTGSLARFNGPAGVAVDSSGIVYVADTGNQTIRKITPDGSVTTLAGTAGTVGSADGYGAGARFYYPYGVSVDAAANVYVADTLNNTIREITPYGYVATIAGPSNPLCNPLCPSGSMDGFRGGARFNNPYGIAMDSAGNAYVADSDNHTIRKVDSGTVTTVAGTALSPGGVDGNGSYARFNYPYGTAVDSSGNVYVADSNNHTIRKITAAGLVTTLAGSAGQFGYADGTGSAARFWYPYGVAVDSAGNVYVADNATNVIRKITAAGVVTTLAGLAFTAGSADGVGGNARFNSPTGVSVDSAGNVFVADWGNQTIRKITPAGSVTTFAGSAGLNGSTDATGSAARFWGPFGVTSDTGGNIYVADEGNHAIRKISPARVVTTFAGLMRNTGSADGTGAAARFFYPRGVAVDAAGNVFVADYYNNLIRKITPTRVVTTIGGLAGTYGATDGTGSVARFWGPQGIASNAAGTRIFIGDDAVHSVRIGTPALPDAATIDAAVGCAGVLRQLDTVPQTASGWQWRIVRQPSGSIAAISSPVIRNPTFTPDAGDRFEFLLDADNGAGISSLTTVSLAAASGPVIVTQPAPQSACVGGMAAFSINSTSATAYQWYKSGGPLTGATGSAYTISPVGAGDAGAYYAVASGAAGCSTTSGNASLTVFSAPPGSPGNSLRAGRSGGLVMLAWTAASGAGGYGVQRCAGACLPATTVASPGVTNYSEPDDASSYFYTITANNACGSTP